MPKIVFFFFSSRRRHTRFDCDWSSDVCSSDLLPPLETYDQRTLFEIIRKMMAKGPDDRFQSADELVNALEAGGGFAAVGLSTAPTRAIPSLAGARLAGAPTTPIPRTPTGARLAAAVEPHHRSVGAGIALWVFVVVVALGAAGLYAYKKGLLFFARAAVPDSVAAAIHDTVAQRLLGDTGASAAADSPTTRAAPPPPPDAGRPIAPGTPGRLTLQGVPAGSQITLNGQPFRGTQGDVPPGTYKLAVRAAGFAPL